MSKNRFDLVAPYYDFFQKLIFGEALIQGQLWFLDQIGKQERVLILGGGTGRLLGSIANHERVDFIDKSEKMIERAKAKYPLVNYHVQDFLEWAPGCRYQVIICPFFLDCFNKGNLRRVALQIKDLLDAEGVLFVTDFDDRYTGRLLSGAMHFFFRVLASLESEKLQPIHSVLICSGFEQEDEAYFAGKRIFSRIYAKRRSSCSFQT